MIMALNASNCAYNMRDKKKTSADVGASGDDASEKMNSATGEDI